MTLSDYFSQNGLDDLRFAEQMRAAGFRVDRATVYRWRHGQQFPRPAAMRAIITATKGKVSAADLLASAAEAA